VLKRFDFRTEL